MTGVQLIHMRTSLPFLHTATERWAGTSCRSCYEGWLWRAGEHGVWVILLLQSCSAQQPAASRHSSQFSRMLQSCSLLDSSLWTEEIAQQQRSFAFTAILSSGISKQPASRSKPSLMLCLGDKHRMEEVECFKAHSSSTGYTRIMLDAITLWQNHEAQIKLQGKESTLRAEWRHRRSV